MHRVINYLQPYKALITYLLKFIGCFCILYFGYWVIDGLSTPRNYYSSFVDHYLNFVRPLIRLILFASRSFLSLLGYRTYFKDIYTLSFTGGYSVTMLGACTGCGVMSFWIAFIFANKGRWQKKAIWIAVGCFAICIINIFRISLLLLSNVKGWAFPFGWDHHSWFNIVSYAFIFAMILLYERLNSRKRRLGLR